MVIFTKKREVITLSGIGKLGIVGFIASIAFSLTASVWSVYLDSFVNSEVIVGLIVTFLSAISFISYFLFIPTIERLDKAKIYIYSTVALLFVYLLFSVANSIYVLVGFAVIFYIAIAFRITSFGIIVKDNSQKTNLSQNEGVVYTFSNFAWIIGPLIAGFVVAVTGERVVFLLSAFFVLISLFIFRLSKINDNNVKKRLDRHSLKNFVGFFKSKRRIVSYIMAGGVSFWWSLIYIYMPLYIIRGGLSEVWVGYFLFAVPVPLILLEYKFSSIAGRIGFRRMFKFGYFIAFIFSILCFFFASNIFFVLSLLVLASVGMAMLEPTRDAYFFDICRGKQDLRFYGPFNTSIDSFKTLANLVPAVFLIFLPFKYIFLVFGFSMLIFFFISFKTVNVIEGKRKDKKKD